MTKRTVRLLGSLLCLALVAIAFGCRKQEQAEPPLAESARPVLPLTRGENFFEQGETRYFPVRFISAEKKAVSNR